MASKYTIRGVADMSQHDEQLRKSAAEVYKYEKQVKQADAVGQKWLDGVKGNISSVTKFLGTIGLATGAVDVFSKSLRHNQTTSDALDNAQAALNTTVNNFYHSLSSGDFTYFANGLSSIISKAKEAQIAIDQLGNTMMSYNIINAKAQNKMAKARAIFYDPKSTKEQKEKAKKDMEDATKELANATKIQIQDIGKVIRTTVARDTNMDGSFITDAMINRALEVNATQGRDKYKRVIEAQYSSYQKEVGKLQKKYSTSFTDSRGLVHSQITDTAAFNRELQKQNKIYAEAIVGHTLLVKYTDEELQNLTQQTVAAYNLDTQLQSTTANQERLNNRAFKTGGGSRKTSLPKNTTEEEIRREEERRIREEERRLEQIEKLREKFESLEMTPKISSFDSAVGNNDFDTSTLRGIENLMNFNDSLLQQLKDIRDSYEEIGVTGGDAYNKVVEKIKETANEQNNLGDLAKYKKGIEDSLEQHKEILEKIQEEKDRELEKERAKKEAMWDSISSMGSAFSSFSKELEIPAFDVMGTIGQAIANVALSYSQAMLKPKDPWSWVAFAAVGLAQMTAVISSLKSATAGYANGGIVGGTTTIGDYNIARVNKGEMILNSREQSRLFNILNGNGGYGGNLDSSTVHFKINGNDLVGVLNNFNKKRSKVM